ncbi:MAG TPA: glycosyltransferase [Acetobacteraceae bacterium]|nr:glycosyltransferase [Acetobacteraceae bacterium]
MASPTLRDDLGAFFDAAWYRAAYPDVAGAGIDPLDHFINHGVGENRNPNPFFDSAWYLGQYPDIARAGIHPLLHYLQHGARELRNPHPRFDAAYYAEEHPEGAGNPLLHHVLFGVERGWATEKRVGIGEYLPSPAEPPACPPGIEVDVVIPVYRGLAQTRRCLESVLGDPERPPGQIVVVDDRSPEPELSAWLDRVNGTGRITLIRNRRNLGFVASVNRGMQLSAAADVVLLNSDTVVPPGWLRRLAGHAHAEPRVASVSPFSNNATICSYPSEQGGPMPAGLTVREMDAACREANGGRSVEVPTTVGFCMYIRRDALREIGLFDAATFGRGYGEENDFCMRAAARGWRHKLACDTFVYHEGNVSFGVGSADLHGKADLLAAIHPDFDGLVARHVRRDEVGPYRFALTAALLRRSGLPTVLQISHGLGGGVRQHIEAVTASVGRSANMLLLSSHSRGVELTLPGRPDHPSMVLGEDRQDDLVRFLRSAAVGRAHVHHLLGMRIDPRELIAQLGVPFDFTVHDFFAVCPQINLLPQRDSQECGSPGPAACNTCIAARNETGARDILSWRSGHLWLLREAERVICPSEDARRRVAPFCELGDRAVVVPHEPIAKANWPIKLPTNGPTRRLRVAVLGVLTSHKGARTVAAVAEMADPARLEIHLIGFAEVPLPPAAEARIRQTGKYEPRDLARLIARARPHVIWFPGQVPETYSYTLTAAIAAGLPIVASRVGSFPERLDGRPLTWLADPAAPAEAWLRILDEVREALAGLRAPPRPKPRRPTADFYADSYLRARTARAPKVLDLRRHDRTTVVVVPERLDDGSLSPCAYIRLLLPLDHPGIGRGMEVVLATPEEAMRYRANILATQRYAVADSATADRLVAHCRSQGMRLLYDIDDDLIGIPPDHPDAETLRPRAGSVARMVREADVVCTSTAPLRSTLLALRKEVILVPNGLDERLWSAVAPAGRMPFGPLRVLFMGTATHDADLALVLPALERLCYEYGERVRIDILGVTRGTLPDFLNRVALPTAATASYPGFVNWMIQQNAWDVGLAPLAENDFNRRKSSIKALDYAALGMAVLASDIGVYRGSIADGPGGMLVRQDPASWFEALSRLVRDWRLLQQLRDGARSGFADYTLAVQATERRRFWTELAATTLPAERRVPGHATA